MSRPKFAQHICVTGSIGSGKSRVCRKLSQLLQLTHLDVDQIAREIMAPGGAGLLAIADYAPRFLRSDGSLDRALLRAEIFNSRQVKRDIDALLHPLIYSALATRLDGDSRRYLIEIPLLFEAGWDNLFETIILVSASRETCLQRITARDKVTLADAEKAHAAQMDSSLKKSRSTFVIENNGAWQDVVEQLYDIVEQLAI